MSQLNRRRFLKSTLAAAGTVAISHTKSSGKILGANEAVRVGVAGLNGRGSAHVGGYLGQKDVRITYLIDPDSRTFKKHLPKIGENGGTPPATIPDVRKALEDKNLDAISIATPNHWHALMTIWACQAGKDVYVEKPCSHNLREGRAAVEYARKHDRIVQHGTQSRSTASWYKLAEVVKSGKYGKLLTSYGLCYKPRKSIGEKPEAPAPAEIDFDLWTGPAQKTSHHGNLVHYNWHWFWEFGNGDIGNQGVHQMDIARWLIPGATLPTKVVSFGGRFGYTDQGQTPNTQLAVFTFPNTETKMVFEVRGLDTPAFHGQKVGNVLKFEQGVVAGGLFYPNGKEQGEALVAVDGHTKGPGDNFSNFIHAVRTRKRDEQNADILEGHYSSALGHLANISYRLGAAKAFGQVADVGSKAETDRAKEYIASVGVKPADMVQVGAELTFDPKGEKFVGNPAADKLLTREYRRPFAYGEL